MTKYLTIALLTMGVASLPVNVRAGNEGHHHPVKHESHKIHHEHHQLAKDHQALEKDRQNTQQARQKTQAAWQKIQADKASGNTAQLHKDFQQFKQDRWQARRDQMKTRARGRRNGRRPAPLEARRLAIEQGPAKRRRQEAEPRPIDPVNKAVVRLQRPVVHLARVVVHLAIVADRADEQRSRQRHELAPLSSSAQLTFQPQTG